MSIELLAIIGGLALLDTLSPATIGVTVYLLLTERGRLGSRLLVYLSVVAGVYFVLGVGLMFGLDALFNTLASWFQNRVVSWILFIIGAVLFIGSFYVPEKKKHELPQPKSKSLLSMVALGLTTSFIEAGTAFPYFGAIGLMTNSGMQVYEWMPVLAGYNGIMVLPPLILYVLHAMFGRSMEGMLDRLRVKVAKLSGSALSWVMCIVGVILVMSSLDYL